MKRIISILMVVALSMSLNMSVCAEEHTDVVESITGTGYTNEILAKNPIKNESADSKEEQAHKRVKRVIKKYIKPDMNKWEKIKVVHDWMVRNITYDYKNYLNGTVPYDSYTAYGAIIKGKSVCQGYTEAFHMFMDELEVECEDVIGDNHAWNMVKIGKNWYHIDVTWDDPSRDGVGTKSPVGYEFFLKSTSKLFETEARYYSEKTSHRAYNKKDYPKCKSTRFDDLYGIRGAVKTSYSQPNGSGYTLYPYYDLSNAYYGYSKEISGTNSCAYDGPVYCGGPGWFRVEEGVLVSAQICSSDYNSFISMLLSFFANL